MWITLTSVKSPVLSHAMLYCMPSKPSSTLPVFEENGADGSVAEVKQENVVVLMLNCAFLQCSV